jgi:hypothetical protein
MGSNRSEKDTENRRHGGTGAAIVCEITSTTLKRFDIEHFTVTIVATRWASNVRRHFATAFWATLEDGCTPTIGATAHFLTAF